MRLTSLTLHGFKSFGNRTNIEFAPGVTAIVGPNGSGKSNVIDALKWASGGGRASEFRAGEKTELIFHGAAGKRSLGYAEVELELRDEVRKLNVFRSLHRDGTGRLRLNGRNARFMDIDEELAGSGLGKSGLAIIGQGEVSGVLMADPAKLLQYVAEVAGVARLAGRREQTEDRLADARLHLERIEDLAQELERQLERLAAEADGAARHAELTRESLRLRYTLANLRNDALRSEIAALAEDRDRLRREVESTDEQIAQGRRELAGLRRAHGESERIYREALAESEARRGDVRVASTRLDGIAGRLQDLRRQAEAAAEELASLQELTEPMAPPDDPADLSEQEARAQARYRAALDARTAADAAARTARAELEKARAAAAGAAERQAAQENRRHHLQHELDELERQLATLAQPGEQSMALARLEEESGRLQEEARGGEEALAALRSRLEQAQADHANAVAEAQARSRAAERSRQAFEARRGYAQGPRNALASGIPGIHGSVADLMRVPDEYREAIGAALGRRVEYVVVDTADTGQKVLDHVRRAGGFVTVLPLELVDARAPDLPGLIANAAGVVGLASELVQTEPRFRDVVHQLLGSTTIIRSMPEAVAVARRERVRPRLVTLEGDLLESYGAMSGGRRQSQASVLGAAAELEDAERAAHEAGRHAREVEVALTELQQRAREAIATAAQRRTALEEVAGRLARAREEAAGRRGLVAELERRRQRVRSELEALEPLPVVAIPAEAVETALAAVEEREAELQARASAVDERQREYAELRQARLVSVERQQAYVGAQARYRRDLERRDSLAERQAELLGALERTEQMRVEANAALVGAERAVPEDVETKAEAHRQAAAELAALEATLTRLGDARTSSSEALERLNLTLARREAALELAGDELRSFPPGVMPLEGSERALRARLTAATTELEELGPVNHRAAQELEQEQARLQLLRSQSEQALEAMNELTATLERLDRETTTRLEAGVTALRHGFSKHVVELFGQSAEADIEVEREDGRPVGMRIRLQPPGKQTRQLNLLSVGERTMGAMAFLFALMSQGGAQGLPIAILDEVDAPLDEANIRRYCDFLTRLARRGTQFVLITHQKATFEVADVIWGVTTEQGVSRVFSIARPEAAVVG